MHHHSPRHTPNMPPPMHGIRHTPPFPLPPPLLPIENHQNCPCECGECAADSTDDICSYPFEPALEGACAGTDITNAFTLDGCVLQTRVLPYFRSSTYQVDYYGGP